MKTNLEIIKKWYETLDPEIVAPDVDWKLADGFPADGHYRGRKAVFEEWLPKYRISQVRSELFFHLCHCV